MFQKQTVCWPSVGKHLQRQRAKDKETEEERGENERRMERERERELTTTTTAMSHHYTPRNKRAARKTPGHQGSPGLEHGSCRAKIIPGRIPVFEM